MLVRARPTCKYSKFSFEIGSPLPLLPADEQSLGGGEEKNKTESSPRDEFLRAEKGRSLGLGEEKGNEKLVRGGREVFDIQRAKWDERDTNRFHEIHAESWRTACLGKK